MLKLIVVVIISLIHGEIFPQSCQICRSNLLAARFLNFPLRQDKPLMFSYVAEVDYTKDQGPEKRTEEYRYIHNGDNVKGTEDIFTGDIQGSDWLKNFDFGKFVNVIIEIKGDRSERTGGVFEWTGELMFIKLFKKRQFGFH